MLNICLNREEASCPMNTVDILPSVNEGPSLPWSYGRWIYNYLYNQCLSPLKLWVRTLLRRSVIDTTLC